jgi:hypothetical protein
MERRIINPLEWPRDVPIPNNEDGIVLDGDIPWGNIPWYGPETRNGENMAEMVIEIHHDDIPVAEYPEVQSVNEPETQGREDWVEIVSESYHDEDQDIGDSDSDEDDNHESSHCPTCRRAARGESEGDSNSDEDHIISTDSDSDEDDNCALCACHNMRSCRCCSPAYAEQECSVCACHQVYICECCMDTTARSECESRRRAQAIASLNARNEIVSMMSALNGNAAEENAFNNALNNARNALNNARNALNENAINENAINENAINNALQ